MQTHFLPPQNAFARQNLKARLDLMLDQKALFKAIDDDPSLIGAGVIFIDRNGTVLTLREFEPICFIKPVRIVFREPPIPMPAVEFMAEIKTGQRESKLALEAAGALVSCSAAVLGWIVVISSGMAIPFTGGGSVILSTLGIAAASASSIQCANAAVRTSNEFHDPEKNDLLDSKEWYQVATLALDTISLGGAAAAGMVTFKGVKLLISQGVSPRKALGGLSRAERKRLTDEVARVRYPGISNKMLKFRKRTGTVPKRYSNEQIRSTTIRQIKDTLGAALSFSGSVMGGGLRQVAVAIYSED